MSLAAVRCGNHQSREAVARCTQCSRFFCRECVTEHDDRLMCSRCLGRVAATLDAQRGRSADLRLVVSAAAGLAIAWLFFLSMGRLLLLIPSTVHEGTLWHDIAEDTE